MSPPSQPRQVLLDGEHVNSAPAQTRYLGEGLLSAMTKSVPSRGPDVAPYLYCGNGHCRDCNLMVEGLADLPACRLPWVEGAHVRSGDAGGQSNALQRELYRNVIWHEGAPLTCTVLVVGAGRSGAGAVRGVLDSGINGAVWVDARAISGERPPGIRWMSGTALSVIHGKPFLVIGRQTRPISAQAVLLATGRQDLWPNVAGNGLAGVVPLDFLERWVELGLTSRVRGETFLVYGDSNRARRVVSALEDASVTVRWRWHPSRLIAATGRHRLEAATFDSGSSHESQVSVERIQCDWLSVETERQHSTSLAGALGCEIFYDRGMGWDVVRVDARGATSRVGIYSVSAADSEEALSEAYRVGLGVGRLVGGGDGAFGKMHDDV